MAEGTRRANREGSVSKRKDGRWETKFTVETPTGPKRRTVYGKSRGDVVRKMAGVPKEETANRWLENSVKDSVRPTTYHRYESVVRLHINPILGGTKLLKLTPARVQALYRERLDAGCSPRTVSSMSTSRSIRPSIKPSSGR